MKKKIPLIVLETLEKYVHLNGENFEVIDPKEHLLRVIDKDKNSDFFFNIHNYKIENGLKLHIVWKPKSNDNLENHQTWIDGKHLDNHFKNWVNLLKGYDKVKTFFDDPIIKTFAEEYYSEFEIIDKDADTKPLTTKQILLLDEHLEYIESNIENYKTEENKKYIEEIKEDVIELRNTLTSKPKAWVVNNLTIIWAKLTKQGTVFLKAFVSEARTFVIKEGVKFISEKGMDLLN